MCGAHRHTGFVVVEAVGAGQALIAGEALVAGMPALLADFSVGVGEVGGGAELDALAGELEEKVALLTGEAVLGGGTADTFLRALMAVRIKFG